jgi:hypothetical protein
MREDPETDLGEFDAGRYGFLMEEDELEMKNVFSSSSVIWAVPGIDICHDKGLAYPLGGSRHLGFPIENGGIQKKTLIQCSHRICI